MVPENPTVPKPVKGQPGVYDVPSDSTPGTVYRVDANGAGFCTCKSFEYRGTCKHLDRMLDVEQRQAATRAMAAPRTSQLTRTHTAERCCACGSNVVAAGTDYCHFCLPGVQAVAS